MVYHWFTTIFVVFLPVVILAIFNFFLIQAVRRSRIARKGMTNQQMSSARQVQIIRQENRITLILIVVVIVFLLCQMPTALVLIYTSVHIVELGSSEDNILRGLGNIFNLLVAINAACNFLLYTALSDKYRKYFCNFFLCRHRGRNNRDASRQFDGSPCETDTMETTFRFKKKTFLTPLVKRIELYSGCCNFFIMIHSFSRGTSLRLDYSPMGQSFRRQNQLGSDLRRANTYSTSRYNDLHPNGFRRGNKSSDSFNERSNLRTTVKDSTIPLITIEQV